jgi:protein MpaA
MKNLMQTTTKLGNIIELVGEPCEDNTLIIGVMHGDEPQGKFLIEEYLTPTSKSMISRWGQLFIPCLNPDGMQLNTRTNANGVDLNRNFPTKNWGEDTSLAGDNPSDYYGGNAPASEIETKFLINVIEKYTPKRILTLHAPYKVVNYDGPAKELAQEISEIIGYPTEESIGYPTPGSFGTWAGVERQISTITLELDETCPVENLFEPVFEIFDLLKNPKTQTK